MTNHNCVTTLFIYILLDCVPIGVKCKDECAVENIIHIYLIVAVGAGVFAKCCSCGIPYQCSNQREEKTVNPLRAIEQHFFLAWFIYGNILIYEKLKTELLRSRLCGQ